MQFNFANLQDLICV